MSAAKFPGECPGGCGVPIVAGRPGEWMYGPGKIPWHTRCFDDYRRSDFIRRMEERRGPLPDIRIDPWTDEPLSTTARLEP